MAKRGIATERREEGRLKPGHVLPLSVVRDADNRRVACRLYDLSADGLCVWVREPLAAGTRVRFVTLKREFLLDSPLILDQPFQRLRRLYRVESHHKHF